MYKRPIHMLMILGALMILVGTGFTANEKPVVAKSAKVTAFNQKADCCDGIPINCETGQACTPEEIEACLAKCDKGKTCTPEEMEECRTKCRLSQAGATGVSAKVNSSKVNALTVGTKSTTAKQCNSNKSCQPKSCGSKSSI